MARCLRCKAGNEWIEGAVKSERKIDDMIHILKYNEGGEVKREEHSDREELDSRIAALVQQGRCCIVIPKQDEAKVVVVSHDKHRLVLGPASGAKFLQVSPRSKMPR